MFTLSCKDLGFERCGFVATGGTTGQVKDALFAHARRAHVQSVSGPGGDEREEIVWAMETVVARRIYGLRTCECA
jgi:predicted small metal-binding protein